MLAYNSHNYLKAKKEFLYQERTEKSEECWQYSYGDHMEIY